MEHVLGNRVIAISRELTKLYEETIRGNASHCLGYYRVNTDKVRGEFVITIDKPQDALYSQEDIDELIIQNLSLHSMKDTVSIVSEIMDQPKTSIYKRALLLSKRTL
jgi:16S rRNA (cytidine1402-2'-O)-methyltransferase